MVTDSDDFEKLSTFLHKMTPESFTLHSIEISAPSSATLFRGDKIISPQHSRPSRALRHIF